MVKCSQARSQKGYIIGRKRTICSQKGQALDPSLSNQQAIKRICVMHRQRLDGTGMVPRNWQRHTARFYRLIKQVGWHGEFAQGPFDGDFPDRYCADMNFGSRIGQGSMEPLWQSRVFKHRPDQDMRINKQLHCGDTALAANIAAISESPSWMFRGASNLPFMHPISA